MSRENSVLKRASRLPMALIPELPEDEAAVTSDPGTEETVDRDDARPLLESQAKIAGQRKMLFTLSKMGATENVADKRGGEVEGIRTRAGCAISFIALAELSQVWLVFPLVLIVQTDAD